MVLNVTGVVVQRCGVCVSCGGSRSRAATAAAAGSGSNCRPRARAPAAVRRLDMTGKKKSIIRDGDKDAPAALVRPVRTLETFGEVCAQCPVRDVRCDRYCGTRARRC